MSAKPRPRSDTSILRKEKLPPATTLGQAFMRYPKSIGEKERIGKLIANSGLAKDILTKYCKSTPFYKELFHKAAGKKWITPSYRPYEEPYNKEALKKIELALQEATNASMENEFCWDLYGFSCARYIDTKFPALEKLLQDVPWDKNIEPDAEALLGLICKNAFEFEVEVAAIENLYELMWIERIENFDVLLKLASQPDEQAVLQKKVDKLGEALEGLKSGQLALQQALEKSSIKLESVLGTVNQQNKQIEENKSSIRLLSQKLTEMNKMASDSGKQLDALLLSCEKADQTAAGLRNRLQAVETKSTHIVAKDDLVGLSESIDTEIAAIEKTVSQISSTVQELMTSQSTMKDAVAEMSNEIGEQASKGRHGFPSSAIYRSPLSGSDVAPPVPFKILSEKVFLETWLTTITREQNFAISAEHLVAIHSVLAANRIVVAERRLVGTWINCLGWRRFVKEMVASPLWSKEEDWREGAEFLFDDRKDRQGPRLLIIHSFDAGIVDCYLSPSLLLWALKPHTGYVSKIILIPSSNRPELSPQLMEHAAQIELKGDGSQTNLRFENSSWNLQQVRGDLLAGVDPKQWNTWVSNKKDPDFDLQSLEKPLNITLSDFTVANAKSTAKFAKKFFDDESAMRVGIHHNVLPWLRTCCTESEFESKRLFLQDLLKVY